MIDDHGVRSEKRIEGQIVKQTSPSTFVVKDKNEGLRKRHVDQMLRRSPRLLEKAKLKEAGEL